MEVPEIIERGNLSIERRNSIIERKWEMWEYGGKQNYRTEKFNYRTEKFNYRIEKFNYRTDPNPRGIGIRRSTKVRYFIVLLYSRLRSIILAPPVTNNQ